MLKSSLVALLSAAGASAQLDIPGLLGSLKPAPANDPRFATWTAPGANDVCSPCPGLNALANHNFIHHDGKNLTLPHFLQGLSAGLNMGPDFTVLIGGLGLLSSPFPLAGSFDLNDLDQHNFPIEHDASLNRKDAYFGNNYDFYNPTWQQTVSFFTATSTGTTALFPAWRTGLQIRRRGTGVDRPRAELITVPSLGQMVFELYSISPAKAPEGQGIAADSYKKVFQFAYGGSKIFNNITSGLASAVGLI